MSKTKVKAKKQKKTGFVALVEDGSGKQSRQKIQAPDRVSARVALADKGLRVLELDAAKSLGEIEIGGRIPDAQLLQFTRQMSAFIGSGISVTKALELLGKTAKHKTLKRAIMAILSDINDGESLGSAVRSQGKYFPTYYSAILEASERSGDMTTAFDTLAGYIERDLTSKRAVRSAMYYPSILVVLGVAAVFLLSTVVLPRFRVFFASLNADLPATTRALMSFSSFFSASWKLILLGLLAFVISIFVTGRIPAGRYLLDKLILKFPVIGNVLELVALERFTRVLGTLSSAGVPLPDSLSLASKVVGNQVFARAITKVRRGVINGEGLSEPMESAKAFPESMVQIVRVGEQTGRLSHQLEQSALMYSKEVDYRMKNLTTLLEPIVLLIVGGGVGFVAIALVSAMYGIYNSGQLAG